MVSDPYFTMTICYRNYITKLHPFTNPIVWFTRPARKEQSGRIAEVQLSWITYKESRGASNCIILQASFLLELEKQSLHHCIPCYASATESWAPFAATAKEKLGQQLMLESEKTLLSEAVTIHSFSSSSISNEETVSLASSLHPF